MTTAKQTLNEALSEVSAKLARVEKKGKAPAAMGGFAFVQESDVVEALKPELDARGIRLVPSIEDVQLHFYERQNKDGPGVLATVKLAMHAVRGDEETLLFRTIGQGADTQDKAPAKAITAAKKQGFLIAFSIPTGDDPEATHLDSTDSPKRAEPTKAAESPAEKVGLTPKQIALLRAKATEAGLNDEQFKTLRGKVTGKFSGKQMNNADLDKLLEVMADVAQVAAILTDGTVVE